MNLDYFRQLAQILPQAPAVLATVIFTKGSVPREVGARMIIYANDRVRNEANDLENASTHYFQAPILTHGTIGGGAGEAKVIQAAIEVLQTGIKRQVTIDLSGATQRETEGICGGIMQVWLERWQGEVALTLLNRLLDRLQIGESVTLVTPFDDNQPAYLAQDTLAQDTLAQNRAAIDSPPEPVYLTESALIEVLQPAPMLLIIGAGHVGEQLAKVGYGVGFQIAIQDDRREWANAQRYPQAALISNQSSRMVLTQFADHAQLYVALVTRGYQYDLEALLALLERDRHSPSPCCYIGMIGSKKRVTQVFQQVMTEANLSEGALNRIYAPIGLDIGALTPEEIAVSIVAELILVRRGGTGRPLSRLRT